MAQHNGTPQERATCLLHVLQWQAINVLQYIPTEVRYDIIEGLESRYGDHQLVMAVLRIHTQQLAHQALVQLPQQFIQREAAHVYVDGISDQEIKHKLLVGGDKMLNKASSLALTQDAAKVAAKTLARLRQDRTPGREQPALTISCGNQ
jgi:hypothetical protein